jgi:iron complex transport system permease protein
MKRNRFRTVLTVLLAAAWPMVIVFAVTVGSADLSVLDSLRLIAGRVPGLEALSAQLAGSVYERIIWQVRLPRVLLACLVAARWPASAARSRVFSETLWPIRIFWASRRARRWRDAGDGAGGAGGLRRAGRSVRLCVFRRAGRGVFCMGDCACGRRVSGVNMLLTGTAVSTLLSGLFHC